MLLRDRADCQKECKTFSGNNLRYCQRNRNHKRNADLQETGNRNSPERMEEIIGRTLKVDVAEDTILKDEMLG